jgi:HEAT repeat protein
LGQKFGLKIDENRLTTLRTKAKDKSITGNDLPGTIQREFGLATPAIVALAEHPSEYVRGAVLRFLRKLAPEEAWPFLERAASDPHFIVRENAADEMGQLGDSRARPHLERLAADPHPHVRQAAETALELLRVCES